MPSSPFKKKTNCLRDNYTLYQLQNQFVTNTLTLTDPLRQLLAFPVLKLIVVVRRDIFFFNDTATTEIYTLSLHDALPISGTPGRRGGRRRADPPRASPAPRRAPRASRSEEHTSELQSPCNLVCRLLLLKKKQTVCVTTTLCINYKINSSRIL